MHNMILYSVTTLHLVCIIRQQSSLVMCDEVGEHIAWDLRPFLHTESFQIIQIPRLMLVDSPLQLIPQIFYGVQVGGL